MIVLRLAAPLTLFFKSFGDLGLDYGWIDWSIRMGVVRSPAVEVGPTSCFGARSVFRIV
jgi:hypothetical protein